MSETNAWRDLIRFLHSLRSVEIRKLLHCIESEANYICPHLGINKLRIYTEEIMIEEKLNELYKRQVEVDKYIKDARKIYNDILISSRRVGKSSDFTGKKFLGNVSRHIRYPFFQIIRIMEILFAKCISNC